MIDRPSSILETFYPQETLIIVYKGPFSNEDDDGSFGGIGTTHIEEGDDPATRCI